MDRTAGRVGARKASSITRRESGKWRFLLDPHRRRPDERIKLEMKKPEEVVREPSRASDKGERSTSV